MAHLTYAAQVNAGKVSLPPLNAEATLFGCVFGVLSDARQLTQRGTLHQCLQWLEPIRLAGSFEVGLEDFTATLNHEDSRL